MQEKSDVRLFCTACGGELAVGGRFCSHCGAAQDEGRSLINRSEHQETGSRRRIARNSFVSLGVALLLAVVALIAWYLLRGNNGYPVLTGAEWQNIILEAIEENKNYQMAIITAATRYMNESTKLIRTGDLKTSRRMWIIGHLLSWYGSELLSQFGLLELLAYGSILERQQAMLRNRQVIVKQGKLSLDVLQTNVQNMNSQLELLGRPKLKDITGGNL